MHLLVVEDLDIDKKSLDLKLAALDLSGVNIQITTRVFKNQDFDMVFQI